MTEKLSNADHNLIDRYYDAVLTFAGAGAWTRQKATSDLVETFSLLADGNPHWRLHMAAVIENGN